MENTVNPMTETVDAATQAPTTPEPTESAPATPQDQLNALIAKRMGSFDIKISQADLKYIKNSINQKIEWKGPNEAYLVIMSLLSIENTLAEMDPKNLSPIQIKLPAATIEAINYFLSKISGKGLDSAQKLFSISMMFRQTMEAIRKLDEEIEFLKNELQINSEKNS